MISELVKNGGKFHFTLIDPDKQSPVDAAKLACNSKKWGSDAIMIGGSTCGHQVTDDVTKKISQKCDLPTILFPSAAAGLSASADYIFWMMLMNSKDRRFLVGEQMKAAPYIRQLGIKTIPMGYIVVSTSSKPTTVEKVGDVEKVGGGDIDDAVAYALCAKYYGMECIYLEAGSGADTYVPKEMIEAVKNVGLPLIVGGGIRDEDAAKIVAKAGADIIVTGTIAEKNPEKLIGIIAAIKN